MYIHNYVWYAPLGFLLQGSWVTYSDGFFLGGANNLKVHPGD